MFLIKHGTLWLTLNSITRFCLEKSEKKKGLFVFVVFILIWSSQVMVHDFKSVALIAEKMQIT